MKIIKHGNPERLKEVMIFTCEYCGCEFEADNTEYEVSHDIYHNDKYYSVKCPECNNTVHNAKEKEYKEYKENPNDNFCPVYGVTPVHSVIDLADHDSFIKNMSPEEMERCLNMY